MRQKFWLLKLLLKSALLQSFQQMKNAAGHTFTGLFDALRIRANELDSSD